MPFVIFVAPYFTDVTVRYIEALSRLPGVQLGVLSMEPFEKLPHRLLGGVAAYMKLADVTNASELVAGATRLQGYVGGPPIHRLFGALEVIQLPVAEARERLGVEGMTTETVQNFRDKARMKSRLAAAGVPCAKHRTARSEDELWGAARELGFPLVVKPPSGASAEATFRVNSADELASKLPKVAPSEEQPALVEELVVGSEHSFETMTIDGKHVWHSLTHYYPTPLEVLRNPWIQWSVVLPREIDDAKYDDIRAASARTLDVLGMQTGLSHMEWFRRTDGSIAISEVGARPPGAQFTTLVGVAHEIDFCYAWARVMVHGDFDPPKRRFAAGIAYLRGQGAGLIRSIEGVEQVEKEIGHLVVSQKLPTIGHARYAGYEGDGFVIVRHEQTPVVEQALQKIISTIRVECA